MPAGATGMRNTVTNDCGNTANGIAEGGPAALIGLLLGQAARAFEVGALYRRGSRSGSVAVVLEQEEIIDVGGEVYQTRRLQPMTLSLSELRAAMGEEDFTPKAGDIVVAADQTFRITDYSGVVTTTQFTVENDRVRIYGVIL